ncbi:MAG: NAD(P)-dependent dehydrogenase (short-subunit alcohol dehydrogenase family) [Cryomorphaceae bacterium]|jgi:NAD(P)-dependent dehydrogenase (short-subunit alcohol dehydrogenase family)
MVSESITTAYSNDLLKGKLALVTGAGKGIGRACAAALAGAGATVIAVARTDEDLASLRGELGELIIPWAMDATSEKFLTQLAQQTDIDILVNNLGSNKPEPFVDILPETYSRIVEMNFGSVFRTTQIVVKNMLQNNISGAVVNITSQMGHVGSPNRTLYCATKHAVEGLTKALAVELAPSGIRVNSVAPTFVDTPLTRPMLDDPAFNKFVMSKIPMGQLANTEDVAAAVVFLASDLSRMVTGTSLLVDGGWTAQ